MQNLQVVIGTRGSTLALRQADIVREALQKAESLAQIEIRIIQTEGDGNQNPIPLDTVGKGWFTKEIEEELLRGSIDIAVHSLKDLPEHLPEGLHLNAYLDREDPRDALVSRDHKKLHELKSGAIIGTDSIRRKVQVLALREDLVVTSLRGNVPTRLEKLESGAYDAVILAVAGLERLGLAGRIDQYFSIAEIMPAPGQGILAIETRIHDERINALMQRIDDREAACVARAERAFSSALGGGCKTPIGACATLSEDTLVLKGMVIKEQGGIQRSSLEGSLDEAERIGRDLAEHMKS